MLSARLIFLIIVSAAALLGSFFITLWLTEPETSDAAQLATRHISSESDLSKAAREIGLHASQRMDGNVDLIRRKNEHEVNATGWVADIDGDATPTDIVVFVGGSMVKTTTTKGERIDVTHALDLRFGSEKNTNCTVDFSCRPNEQPIIVGIRTTKHYIALKSGPCP
jgi:hypothetical protein